MNNITVGIKAFIRVAELERALESLVDCGFAEVIVADDSHMNKSRSRLYQPFKDKLPLRVLELPFRTGVSYGRNRMVEACSTPYFLLMDDDLYLENDLSPMLEILESDPRLGGISAMENRDGYVHSGAGNLHLFNSFVIHDVGYGAHAKVKHSKEGAPYFIYDMINNFALFRIKVFDDVLWDEAIVTSREHIDFYLSHKELGKWQFAVTPSCTYGHAQVDSDESTRLYNRFRHDPATYEAMNTYFKNKWGLKRGIIWGLSHLPKSQSLKVKARLVHALLGFGQLFPHVRKA